MGIDRKTLSFVYDFDENGKKVSKNVVINLTDTAGQERYKSITQSYYKGSNGVILLYDITDRKSFEHLNEWISNVRNSVGNYEESNYTIFLLGTKMDLVVDDEKRRQVTVEEAKEKCQEFDLEWGGECSSKDFSEDDYKKIFKEFVKKIYDKIGYNVVMRQTISTLTPGKNKKRNCGC